MTSVLGAAMDSWETDAHGPDLPNLAAVIHDTAKDKGWWDSDRNFGEVMANIHSEATEAWAEYVHNHGLDETYYTMDSSKIPSMGSSSNADRIRATAGKWMRFQDYLKSDGTEFRQTPDEPTPTDIRRLVEAGILEPHGVPTELADIIIRCLDMFAAAGVDPDAVVQEKMRYNLTRARRHGGKRA
jgi:hypothetical protein